MKVVADEAQTYERMIRKLVEWKPEDGFYLARVTPYVFVAASMLGADFEILATYQNPAGGRTYHSYFVVNRKAFTTQPTLDQLMQKLRDQQTTPAKFIYHDKFSTSSYFLPSLFFRSNDIYSMPNAIDDLKAVTSQDINANIVPGQDRLGSSELVTRVANEQADIAAVWDVTKEAAADKDKVYFVQLPIALPNDLLVCSAKLEAPIKDELRNAIRAMAPNQIDSGDFKTWVDIDAARDAKLALGELTHLAEQRSAAITIKIMNSSESPVSPANLQAIAQAIRLSNTEFIPYDEDYHARADIEWCAEMIHDGAIRLCSKINDVSLDTQEFEISFTDGEDLKKRVGGLIHSRMHRIRYVWPYEDHPTVIRDVEFPIVPKTVFKVVKTTWKNPKRNDFYFDDAFDATVSTANSFGFQLAGAGFPAKFDPMSNVSYRVILVRPPEEGRGAIVTVLFVGLLLLAGIGAAFDLQRKRKKLQEVPLVNGETFKRTCRKLAENYRSFWRTHRPAEADVLWCDRDRLEKIIADLKASGSNPDFDVVRSRTRSVAILANVPLLNRFLNLSAGSAVNEILTMDPSKVSDTRRLGDTIKFLIDKQALSPFVGEKLEWDALNQIASEIFEPVSLETSQTGINGDDLIWHQHPMLLSLVARHFTAVIEESKQNVCFFSKKWRVKESQTETTLAYTSQLVSPVAFNGKKSMVQSLILRAQVPSNAEICDLSQTDEVNAWVLGKICRVDAPRNGDQTLMLTFRPAALVKIDDSE